MPTITVNKSDLERLAGKTYNLSELEKALEIAKAEVKIGDEDELRIQLKDTNRPDLWSSEGLARLLRGYRQGYHNQYMFFTEPAENREVIVNQNLENIRPYIAAFSCSDIQMDKLALKQLIDTQEKLADNFGRGRSAVAIGIFNATNIRFPICYDAVDPGATRFVPLGSDTEMDLYQILREHPTGQSYAHLLESFQSFPLIRDSRGEVLSFPPIINSRNLGQVKEDDSILFCEASGNELDAVLLSISIMAANLADRGGKILPVNIRYPYDTPRGQNLCCPIDMTESIYVSLSEIQKVVGGDIPQDSIFEALISMGYRDVALNRDGLNARPAPYRDDILHPVDLIEDILIAIGYETFTPEMPQDFTIGQSAPQAELSEKIRNLMVGCGFQEIFLSILSSSVDQTQNLRIPNNKIVEIANPMSDYYSSVRASLLPGLLSVERASRQAIYPHRTFEVGEVEVIAPEENYGTRTEMRLAAVEAYPKANLSSIQSTLEAISYYLGFEYTLDPVEHPTFIPGRSGQICRNGTTFGLIGELHPEILEIWDIGLPVSAFEINTEITD